MSASDVRLVRKVEGKMANEKQKVSVLVGFGGTGGKVLREFAELLVSDAKWKEKAPSHVYLVLCDTAEDDLNRAAAGIESVFPNPRFRPSITRIPLAEGLGSFSKTVSRQWEMAGERGEAGVKRLEHKWWCQEGSPFTAHRVPYNIDEGAGQCPMVSYFLAWWQGTRIRDHVDTLVAEIDNRVSHGGDRPSMELTVVNSLAGGTGRGSWTVLTFLIRRALERSGWDPSAIGLFLDQSCFTEVMKARPEQRFKLKINALTGLSEVVMWTRIDDIQGRDDKPAFHLPELSSPERSDLDLIRTFKEERSATPTPLGYAQVIFGAGRSGGLPDVNDYYTVAASALYARLAMPALKIQEQNAFPRIGGVGSTRVDVPYVEVEAYLRLRSVTDLLENAASDDVERRAPIHDWLGCFGAHDNKSGRESGLLKLLEDRLAEAADSDAMVKMFIKEVDAGDDKKARNALRAICDGNIQAGRERLRDLLKSLDKGRSPFSLEGNQADAPDLDDLGGLLIGAIRGKITEDLASLATMQATAAGIANELSEVARTFRNELKKLLGAGTDEEAAERRDGAAAARLENDLKTFASSRSLLSLMKRFDANERDKLKMMVPQVWIDETLIEVLRQDLIPAIERAANDLEVFARNLAKIVKAGFKGQWRDDLSNDLEKLEQGNFIVRARKNGVWRWDLEGGFRESRSALRYIHRRLRPCLDDQQFSDYCEVLRSKDVPRAIQLELAEKLCRRAAARNGSEAGDGLATIGDEEQAAIRREIKSDIQAMRQAMHVSPEWMKRHFTFEKVVERQLKAWDEVFQQVSGHAQDALCTDFELFYGIPPEIEKGEKPHSPALEDVLHHLVLSAARSCEPMLRIRPGYEPERRGGDRVDASLPSWFGKAEDPLPQFRLLMNEHKLAGLSGRSWVHASENPYVLTIYANQGFTHKDSGDHDRDFARISSLDYWMDSDEDNIADWLNAAEDLNGRSVFSKEMRNSGLGFPDPSLVRDPAFASLRWRPWFRREEAERESREHRAVDAVLHAMSGHVGSGTSAEVREAIAELQERLLRKELHEWAMPNVRWESRRMWFQRNPVEVKEKLATANLLVKRAPVKLTLTKFLASLQGDDEITRKKVDAILAERDYFLNELRSEVGIGENQIAALHQGLEDFLVDLELEVETGGGADRDAFVTVVQELLARHRAVRPSSI